MSGIEEGAERPLPDELSAVAQAAGARLRAETEEELDGVGAAAEALISAATSAIGGGHSLSEIARAEAYGQEDVRRELRADVIRRVERTSRQVREAEANHHRAIARATRLGLSTREIAHSAGVTHGTIRAITNRWVAGPPTPDVAVDEPPAVQDEGPSRG